MHASYRAFASLAEFRSYFDGPVARARLGIEHVLAKLHAEHAAAGSEYRLGAHCNVCRDTRTFVLKRQGGEPTDGVWPIDWRESTLCEGCGMTSRQRAMLHHVEGLLRNELAGPRRRVLLLEQVTPFHDRLNGRVEGVEVIGSEFVGADAVPGSQHGSYRHENVQDLSFADGALDLVVSNDVLEHVPEPEIAFRELARVLRPGGRAVHTIPFYYLSQSNRQRARLENGRPVHLLPPLYHGDPLSPEGVLVYTDFGWEIVEQLRACGFRNVEVLTYWSYEHAHLGVGENLLTMQR